MLLLNTLRFILIFPFVILIVLKYLGISRKQRHLFVAPVYMYTFVKLTVFVFDGIFTFLFLFTFAATVFVISYRIVKKEYKTILGNLLIRKYLFVFGRLFPFYYIVVAFIGIIKY